MLIFKIFQFEERKYQGGKHWVSHKKTIKKSEMKKSDSELFMSLFNYITGKNETGTYLFISIR